MQIENGFIIGVDWHSKGRVMVNASAVLRIELDCGNSPPANRLYFLDARIPHVDLLIPTDEA